MHRVATAERGFTLVELLVYMLLMVLVLAVAGGLLSTTLIQSTTVRAVDNSSTAAQLAADSIETGIRNSSDFSLSTPIGNDQLLVARVASNDATLTWSCVAWYYSASGRSLRMTRSATAIAAPTAAQLSSWTLLVDGVSPISGNSVFATTTGRRLTIAFNGLAGDHPPVAITTSAFGRAGATGSVSCY
ncbi:pilin/secretion family protein with methylation motif [Microterricola gilva]|uniref:Pilin/secretion family protein with methylation motif n=1 Tax=Microterricola gilva TaxID=393267 RepID=A0A4Q8AI59_9MICO|nr:prepilin-type N-terminal cleavage/methylation domain-containing protein [Microterricola gilva]RZU64112.1 pilin/secretion family protein with methylation motif [Microterricola gilva]